MVLERYNNPVRDWNWLGPTKLLVAQLKIQVNQFFFSSACFKLRYLATLPCPPQKRVDITRRNVNEVKYLVNWRFFYQNYAMIAYKTKYRCCLLWHMPHIMDNDWGGVWKYCHRHRVGWIRDGNHKGEVGWRLKCVSYNVLEDRVFWLAVIVVVKLARCDDGILLVLPIFVYLVYILYVYRAMFTLWFLLRFRPEKNTRSFIRPYL